MNTIAAAMIILILICPRISRSPITAVIMDLKLIISVINIVLITITVIAIIIIIMIFTNDHHNCHLYLHNHHFYSAMADGLPH